MTIDIVKRLRELGDWEVGDVKSDAIYHAAADEIELLRKQLAHSVDLGNSWLDEIERLREENKQYLDCLASMAHAALAVLKPKEPQA